jgi:GH18 family chitinase
MSCFANVPCGKSDASPANEGTTSVGIFNFAAMVEKIPSHCKDNDVMSQNVGYWQSWSIYQNKKCNPFTAESINALS